MRHIFLIAVALVLVLTGCQKENLEPNPVNQPPVEQTEFDFDLPTCDPSQTFFIENLWMNSFRNPNDFNFPSYSFRFLSDGTYEQDQGHTGEPNWEDGLWCTESDTLHTYIISDDINTEVIGGDTINLIHHSLSIMSYVVFLPEETDDWEFKLSQLRVKNQFYTNTEVNGVLGEWEFTENQTSFDDTFSDFYHFYYE